MHKGRTGEPVVLIIGDEACPMTVGRTIEVGKDACCWVFKREHLGLEEVGEIVRKINAGKRDADKRGGRRQFEFFLPRGSKILVGSYVHLRLVGMEGYVTDFNKMVRDVWGVTGDNEVEVLPYVPVVMEGMDERGRELLAGLRDWVRWVGGRTERESVKALAGTGGVEREGMVSGHIQYVPAFLTQKEKGNGGLGGGTLGGKSGGVGGGWRGRELQVVSGERRELEVRRVLPARDLGRMAEERGVDTEDERVQRECLDHGVSMEAEFAFTRAIGDFCREGVREGSFRGNYVLNVREQMEERVRVREGESKKCNVLFVGGSQIGRMWEDIAKVGKQVVREGVWVRVNGFLSEDEAERVVGKVMGTGKMFDRVVIGGPGNSLVLHGKGGVKSHRPERTVTVEKDVEGKVVRMESRYHLTEPVRISMAERRELAVRTGRMVGRIQEVAGVEEVVYITMFPRHVDRCCGREGHMTEGDCLSMASLRLDMDRDILEEMRDRGVRVKVVEWWKLLKMEGEGTVREVLSKGVVCGDGVHLTAKMNKLAAVSLCHRLMETGEEKWSEDGSVSSSKRIKLG
jgi:hypothetical protein